MKIEFSPNMFYEYRLKGKDENEIRCVIQELKEEIQKIKEFLENPDEGLEPKKNKMLLNRIIFDREYLKRSIKEIQDLGIEYKPDQEEQKAYDFQNNIEHISKISFNIGGYFEGYTEYCIEFIGDYLELTGPKQSPPYRTDIIKCEYLRNMSDEPLISKEDFVEYIKKLYIGEWLTEYRPERFGYCVMDGTQWEISIEYDNDINPVKISGSNSYPYNFEKFQHMFGYTFYDNHDDDSDMDDKE